MKPATLLTLGGLNAALAIVAGAFAAHGLEDTLPPNLLDAFKTGAQYHMYHALGLGLVGVVSQRTPASRALSLAGWLMLTGVILFSGSLYALALSGITVLGAITPLGGVVFISAWLAFAWHGWRSRD
ncbi:MAG: DUF423 domain-containing protein [Pseudomonadota bacterium]